MFFKCFPLSRTCKITKKNGGVIEVSELYTYIIVIKLYATFLSERIVRKYSRANHKKGCRRAQAASSLKQNPPLSKIHLFDTCL